LFNQGPRTQKQKLQELLADDSESSPHAKGSVALVNTALRIETDRYVIKLISDCAMIDPAAAQRTPPSCATQK
jgi:hypothetical protein